MNHFLHINHYPNRKPNGTGNFEPIIIEIESIRLITIEGLPKVTHCCFIYIKGISKPVLARHSMGRISEAIYQSTSLKMGMVDLCQN